MGKRFVISEETKEKLRNINNPPGRHPEILKRLKRSCTVDQGLGMTNGFNSISNGFNKKDVEEVKKTPKVFKRPEVMIKLNNGTEKVHQNRLDGHKTFKRSPKINIILEQFENGHLEKENSFKKNGNIVEKNHYRELQDDPEISELIKELDKY